jgi:ligand-binding sensor domain-containing protein
MGMIKINALVACMAACLLAASAGQEAQKADSIGYEQKMVWTTFSSSQPVKEFTARNDALWYATQSGLHEINIIKNKEVQTLKSVDSIPASGITALATDVSGSVWIGTAAGVVLKTEEGYRMFDAKSGLPDNAVNAIAAAKNGSVWIGTKNGACVYKAGVWTTYATAQGLCGNNVHCLAIDDSNVVWFGTDKGISAFDGAKWKTYTTDNGLSWNDTRAIAFDSHKNRIWAAVGDKDINTFDGQSWNVYMDVADGICCIMIDTQSRIWLCSANGIIKFNGDEWISDPKIIGVPAQMVSGMYCDEQGNLWFGTEKGVIRLANPYPF